MNILKLREVQQIQHIVAFLNSHGWYVWHNNRGMSETHTICGSGKDRVEYIRFGKKGSSDILGISPEGRFVAINVCEGLYGDAVTLTSDEIEFKESVERQKGLYMLVTGGFGGFLKELEALKEDIK